jgi:hypothetical protein
MIDDVYDMMRRGHVARELCPVADSVAWSSGEPMA